MPYLTLFHSLPTLDLLANAVKYVNISIVRSPSCHRPRPSLYSTLPRSAHILTPHSKPSPLAMKPRPKTPPSATKTAKSSSRTSHFLKIQSIDRIVSPQSPHHLRARLDSQDNVFVHIQPRLGAHDCLVGHQMHHGRGSVQTCVRIYRVGDCGSGVLENYAIR